MKDPINQTEKKSLQLLQQEAEQGIKDLQRLSDGMQVTLYIPHGEEVKYNKIIEEIEKALTQAKITSGTIDKSDRQIGTFSSVRHEGISDYKSHDKVTSYNPDGVPDPFRSSF